MSTIELLLILSAVSQMTSEKVFGGYLKGPAMWFVAMAVSIGLTFAAWGLSPQMEGLAALKDAQVVTVLLYGIAVGFGSDVLNAFVTRFLPGVKGSPLPDIVSMIKKPASGTEGNELENALIELNEIQKQFTAGAISAQDAQVAVSAWKAKHPKYAMFVPPGFPGAPS